MHTKRRIIAVAVLISALLAASALLVRYWYLPTYSFIYTDNARIEGALVKVAVDKRGQVAQLPFDTGDEVERLQPVATLKITLPASNLKYIYENILAPISGTIVNRGVNLGDMVSPGQPLLTIVDLNELWVIANIDENEITRIQPGQRVDIHVDATGETLMGRVEYIVPTTTSLVQQSDGSSLIVAASTQDVPVKISLEQKSGYRLYPGLSVEVTIYTK